MCVCVCVCVRVCVLTVALQRKGMHVCALTAAQQTARLACQAPTSHLGSVQCELG